MSSLNTSAFVRPAFFIINGFTDIPYINYYYIFLCFCYIATLVGNLLLMTVICAVRSLHTPKYMAVFTLALSDSGESTAIIPKLMETFLFNTREIGYEACMTSMFFVFFFYSLQSLTLTVLAYDRFVAICFPLRYHSIVTNTSMGVLILMCLVVVLMLMSVMMVLFSRLSFCETSVIDSFFCDPEVISRIACNENYIHRVNSLVDVVAFMYLPMALIGLSYTCILLSLFKIASWDGRLKALKTCFSHLILVAVFYIPLAGIYMAALSVSIHPNVRIINTSLSFVIPPMLNPIVYSLNTAEIKEFVKKMFRRNRHKGIIASMAT